MPSKMVADRQKSNGKVQAAADANAPLIDEALRLLLSKFLTAGQTMPDIKLFVGLLNGPLQEGIRGLVSADEAHEAEKRDDAQPRDSRDQIAEEIRAYLLKLRDSLSGIFGSQHLPKFGLAGETPRDPVLLERLAGEVVQALNGKLPPAEDEDIIFNPVPKIAKLTTLRTNLQSFLKDVDREARELEQTQINKDKATELNDETFSSIALILVGLLRLAGHKELAKKLRPSRRRPGQTAEDANEELTE